MPKRRGPFDSRLDKLEQTTELPEPGEQDVYAMPERESAVALAPGHSVYRPFQVFQDEGGEDYYGIMNGEGNIERMPVVQSRRKGRKVRGGKHSLSGRT